MKRQQKHIINPETWGYKKMEGAKAVNIRYVDRVDNEHTLVTLYDDNSYTLYSDCLITYVGKYGVMVNTHRY